MRKVILNAILQTAERAKVWIATIEKAPRSFDAIQSIMDAKEVAMNKTSDIRELGSLIENGPRFFGCKASSQRRRHITASCFKHRA